MPSDLVFSLGADISVFERLMAQAVSFGSQAADKLTAHFKTSSEKIDAGWGTNLAGLGKFDTAIGALKIAGGVFLGFEVLKSLIGAIADGARDAKKELDDLAAIGTKARNLGVGSSFLQGFTGQAKQLGLEQSQLEQMLSNAREASTTRIGEDGGKTTSAIDNRLKQNVMAGNLPASAQSSLDAATSQEERIRVVLSLMAQMQAKGEQLAAIDLGKTMFGADFETAVRTGVDVIGTMKTALDGIKATSEGRVKSEQEIFEALRIQAEYADQDKRLAAAWASYEESISSLKQEELQAMATLRGYYVDVVEAAAATANWIMKGVDAVESLANKIDDVFNNAARRVHDMMAALGVPVSFPTGGASDSWDRPLTIHKPIDTSHALPSLDPSKERHKADPVEEYIKSLSKEVAALQGESTALGLSSKAKQESIDIAKAEEAARERGSALTDDERQKVLKLADSYAALKQQQAGAKAAQDVRNQISDLGMTPEEQRIAATVRASGLDEGSAAAKNYADQLTRLQQAAEAKADIAEPIRSLTDALIEGRSAADAMRGALISLAEKASDHVIDMLLSSAFSTPNVLGLFGLGSPASAGGIGHNAGGTDDWRGGPTWVGEQGPEIVNLPRHAQVMPNHVAMPRIPTPVAANNNVVNLGGTTVHVTGSGSMSEAEKREMRAYVTSAVIAGNAATVKQLQGGLGKIQGDQRKLLY